MREKIRKRDEKLKNVESYVNGILDETKTYSMDTKVRISNNKSIS